MSESVHCFKGNKAMFVALKAPQLTLNLNPGEQLQNGKDARPKYASFHPGPAGGELLTSDSALIKHLRERDNANRDYREVVSDEDYGNAVIARDLFVRDEGPQDRVQRGAMKKIDRTESVPAPESTPAPEPKAAKTPWKKQALAA